MGIQGLLPLLKSIHKPTHLRNFAGQTLGVDAYGWLHRGTVSCAIELAQQKPTRKHIDFALSRVRMLIHFGIKPYLVFDGAYLPSKEHTEKERAAKRKESKKLGLELLSMGRVSQAYLELQKAIDVTPTMARELIEELKRLDVPYVVAPYEADSQLAYLEKHNYISGVISEDSDLLVFGVTCLLTKLDQYGECVMVSRNDFTACREVSLVGWTDKEFRMMAMLSGCDYLPGIDRMGLKTAYRLVRKHKAIDKVVRAVQFDGKMKVAAGYLEAFSKAEKTFLYQWVFCPKLQRMVHLNQLPAELEEEDMSYLGEETESKTAAAIAVGDLDPNTKERLIVNNVPRPSAANHSRAVQTPDEKQGKPISEFFKPVRTPLAELDPNSFTPSPSQQHLLQSQQGLSWSASQAHPRRPSALSRVATTNALSSALQGVRRVHSEPKAARKSPKRQRLCSDSVLAASTDDVSDLPGSSSRFFTTRVTEHSPSLRKPSIQKKNKKDDFELWSDDSVAEALADIAAVEESAPSTEAPSPKKRKKFEVFADSAEVKEADTTQAPSTEDSSQDTVGRSVLNPFQDTIGEETPETSFETEETLAESSVFRKSIDADFAAFKAKYTFQSVSPRKKFSRAKSMPAASKTHPQEPRVDRPLGAIANSARTSRYQSNAQYLDTKIDQDMVKDQRPAIGAVDHETSAVGTDSQTEDIIDDAEWLEIEKREVSSTLGTLGSEDCLIPNSPESRESDTTSTPKLDLGRFAFAGHYSEVV